MGFAIGGRVSRRLQTAVDAVVLVEAYFREREFQVFDIGHPSANGQDMTVAKDGRTYRVEVKAVIRGKRCFLVKAVKPHRRKDDWIALVYDCHVFVQPMADHLRCCGKDGTRHLSDLVLMRDVGAL